MAKEKELKAKISIKDNFTKPIDKIIKKTNQFSKVANNLKKIVLKADDKVSKTVSKVSASLKRLNVFKKFNIYLNARDKISGITSKVRGSLKKLQTLKSVKLLLDAKDKATAKISKVYAKAKAIGGKVYSMALSAKDNVSKVLGGITGKLMSLAKGVIIPITLGLGAGLKGMAQEETQKITINRVIENSGKGKKQAKKSTDEYYKYLENYANKTPFTTQEVAQFGTKGAIIAKGDIEYAKKLTDAQANVKGFVGDLRTSTEVSEAFFSASNGNMEMLNNMLGENYKTFDQALEGIKKKQGGLVDEMSTTTGGLFSTIVGKAQVGMKKFTQVFEGPLKNAMNNVSSFMDGVTNVIISVGQKLLSIDWGGLFASFDMSSVTNALAPVVGLFERFFNGIETKSPVTMGIMQILGTVFNTVWNTIGAVINAVSPIVEKIFIFIGEHGEQISNIVKGLGAIWEGVWTVVGVLLEGAWAICKPLLSALLDILSDISDMVQSVGKWWKDMCAKINNNPIVATVKKVFSGGDDGGSKKKGKRSAFGTREVRGNDVPFRLHDGERILTKGEAKRLDSQKQIGNGVVVQVNGLTVREEADIDRIATKLVKKLNQNKIILGGTV